MPAKQSRRDILKLALAGGAFGAFGMPHALAQATPRPRLPIAMNLAGITDWEPGFPFMNLMLGARVWMTKNASKDGPFNTEMIEHAELDENGYPLEVPFTPKGVSTPQVVFTILPNTLKPGRYVILHDGEGLIAGGGGTKILETRPGRVEIGMRHAKDLIEEIRILESVRGNHIRNVRILPLEHEHLDVDKNPFRPEAIEFCKPWHCLRFMDWLGTNNSGEQTWARRKQRSFYTQAGASQEPIGMFGAPSPEWQRPWGSGVSLEHCIDFANAAKSDAWFCVPHLADDEYITEMAKLVKEKLDPSLKVYVEFSNEIWNWQFLQAQWMLRSVIAGDLAVAGGSPPPWEGQKRPSEFKNGIVVEGAGNGVDHPERTGALFRRCFKIWEDVFHGADMARLVRVCAIQAVWLDTATRTLEWVMRNGGCDALSPAGYFGPNDDVYERWEAKGAALTADDVVADMRNVIVEQRSMVMANAALAQKAGVRLIVYEGGQHIQPKAQEEKPYNDALGAAQKHPKMYDLYMENLQQYVEAGCDLYCAFSSIGAQGTRWGSWGHAEKYDQSPEEMPKLRAILDANIARSS